METPGQGKISAPLIIRYTLLQLPALGLVAALVLFFGGRTNLAWYWQVIIISAWALKDIIMFPFVWRSYSTHPHDTVHSMIGKTGTAVDTLAPRGRVLVDNEVWQAHSTADDDTILSGGKIIVVDMKGLTLKVKSHKEM